jgi:putative ABC transport system permease protein
MIKNYLKVAWRNLSKYKAHTFINVAGLSIGLACSLLILLWVQNEKSIDGFHSSSLYRVYETVHNNGQISGTYDGPGPLAGELKRMFPEVQYATSMGFGELSTFQAGNKVLRMNGNSAEADYFKMFSYPLLEGNAENALKMPFSLAISRKMAKAFYGSPENAIGKTIRYQNSKNFTITAVFEDLPANVSITYDFLTNWDTFLGNNGWAREMGNNGPPCFVTLRKDANATLFDRKLNNFFDVYYHTNLRRQAFHIDLAIQPYAESYLNNDLSTGKPSGGRIETVRLFSVIAVFILLIACINFMNLATARSVKRAREVGVRKAIGALRSSLIQQFISESLMITFIAVVFSVALVIVLLPVFNDITQKQISLPFNQWQFWLTLTAITVITGLVSGSYPALFLSSLKPVKVLKGALKLDTGTTMFRKGLVVFQFVLSAILITGTIIVSRQMNYIQSRYLGYDKENLVYIATEGELNTKYQLFKQELLSKADIQSVSKINTAPQDIYGSTGAVGWIGKDTSRIDMFTQVTVGYDFMKTMKLGIVVGRDFSKEHPTDSNNYILNETAIKATGYKNPIGKPFRLFGRPGTIIGVVKDFNFHSMSTAIGPIVFHYGENTPGVVLIRTQAGRTKEALADIEALCKQINPAFPPTWYFVDQQYQKMYQNEQVINKLADAFAGLAIFISCLGLLGLAMFTAEQRRKEISIRKVLGASIGSLFELLSREFIILILIAFVIATPSSWYAMNKWLMNYVYHTPLQWWVFALSAALILFIALATISFQVIKAALVNPVKSLRSE